MRVSLWPLVLGSLLTFGCATTSVAYHPQKDCAAGSASACEDWGDTLVKQGDEQRAEEAYGQACDGGLITSCITQGQLLIQQGELDAAETPLRRAYLDENPRGYEALAELYQARGDTRSLEIAQGLRFEAPAIDKPATEVISRFSMNERGKGGSELIVNIQPMALLSRRLTLGMHVSFGSGELNGFVGYQHFVSSWAVPFARVMLGKVLGAPAGEDFNYGGELGVKLCLGPVGHLEFAIGSSRAGPLHMSVGLGLNGIIVLLAAAR